MRLHHAHLAIHFQSILTAQDYLSLSEGRKGGWADAPTMPQQKVCNVGVVQILASIKAAATQGCKGRTKAHSFQRSWQSQQIQLQKGALVTDLVAKRELARCNLSYFHSV